MTITAKQTQEILELAERATKGPWWYDSYNTVFSGSEQTHDLLEICQIPDEPETGESEPVTRDRYCPESASNAGFIARARTALPEYAKVYQEAMKRLELEHGDCLMCETGHVHECSTAKYLAAYHAQEKAG